MPKAHIIGAGLAGLAAAVRLCKDGFEVALYESAGQAGGRCRSFYDKTLDHLIDNGNHLLLSGNKSALTYVEEIGAEDPFDVSEQAIFPFYDMATGERWSVKFNEGPVPLWAFSSATRIPNTSLTDYLSMLPVLFAGKNKTVSDLVSRDHPLYERFWEPMTIAVLNSKPEIGAAHLLGRVFWETFVKGAAACRPMLAKEGLGPSLVEPAVQMLSDAGYPIRFNQRLKSVKIDEGRVTGLEFDEGTERVRIGEAVVMALPPSRLSQILPRFSLPDEGEVIVNAHYRVSEPTKPIEGSFLLGLVNAKAQWAFLREDIISLTISAASEFADIPQDELLESLWSEVRLALDLSQTSYESGRIIREKRATFDQSIEGVSKRKKTQTELTNLFLAGDWTDTGLPATIEGAIRSGHKAVDAVKAHTIYA